jgi:hypothetical protein
MEFDIWVLFLNVKKQSIFFLNTARISGTLYENLGVFVGMKKFQTEIVKKINTNFV